MIADMQATQKKLPHSVRKFIRTEKTRIRGQFSDVKKQEEMIIQLYDNAWGKEQAVKETAPAIKPEAKKEAVKPKKEKSVKVKSKSK